jgi:hypothetical protein
LRSSKSSDDSEARRGWMSSPKECSATAILRRD